MKVIPDNSYLKLTPGSIEHIRKMYGLDKPGRLEEAINILEEWIRKQDHFIKKDFSKDYLEKTLITCDGSVEMAKKQIDWSCTMKTLLPKYFTKTNAKMELQSILDSVSLVPLPSTEDNYRVILVSYNAKEFTIESFMQYFQYLVIVSEYLKANDYVNGFIIINDYRHLNLYDLLLKTNTVDLQQIISILIEGYGAKTKYAYVLTNSKIIELLIKIIKPFLGEEHASRIRVIPTLEELHKAVPKEILPQEYGGNEKSIEILRAEWVAEICSDKHVEYMKMMNKACTDETKRHAGKFNEDYSSMPGSFRSLSVD